MAASLFLVGEDIDELAGRHAVFDAAQEKHATQDLRRASMLTKAVLQRVRSHLPASKLIRSNVLACPPTVIATAVSNALEHHATR